MTRMRNVLAAGAAALAACASAPDVRVEYDPAISFDTYRTFAFDSPTGAERAGFAGISRYLAAATRRELEARGLRYQESLPDLLVNFGVNLVEKQSGPAAAPIAGGGYYGYRRGSYSAWNGYPWSDPAMQYTEGTLNIDIVDARRRQLVWEGVVVGVVTTDNLADPRPAVDGAVNAAMQKFPRASK